MNNNNNEYFERLTRIGPKRLHVLYKYVLSKFNAYNTNAHTRTHAHMHTRRRARARAHTHPPTHTHARTLARTQARTHSRTHARTLIIVDFTKEDCWVLFALGKPGRFCL